MVKGNYAYFFGTYFDYLFITVLKRSVNYSPDDFLLSLAFLFEEISSKSIFNRLLLMKILVQHKIILDVND